MDSWLIIFESLGQIFIPPLILIGAFALVIFITTKFTELKGKYKDEKTQKYLELLNDSITTCVIATSQTYVTALKKEGIFNEEAQKKALQMTYDAVMKTLTVEAQELLQEVIGDLQGYIINHIEADVAQTKSYVKY